MATRRRCSVDEFVERVFDSTTEEQRPRLRRNPHTALVRTHGMGFGKDVLNGLISLVLSVAITVALADDEDQPYDLTEVALAVEVSAFLSGFFTSYFAPE